MTIKLLLFSLLAIFLLEGCGNTIVATEHTFSKAITSKRQTQVEATQLPSEAKMRQAQIELDIFSGRKSPTWSLSEAETKTLLNMISSLPSTKPAKFEDNLGYRGFLVKLPDAESLSVIKLKIYKGTIQYEAGGKTQFLSDTNRTVERWLLASGKPHLASEVYTGVETQL
jgi:hypothetical protein